MDLLDRLIFFTIGSGVGFILGFVVARLREIRDGVDEVLDIEKEKPDTRKRDEQGGVKRPSLTTIGLALTLIVTAGAAFQTGRVNNELKHTNAQLEHTVTCITEYNVRQGRSLKSRDAAIKAGTQSEIDLWTTYARLYALATSDPKKIPIAQEALNRAIHDHRERLVELQAIRSRHPYPDPDILKNCKEN